MKSITEKTKCAKNHVCIQHRAQVFKRKYLAGLQTNTLEINSITYFSKKKNPSRRIKS